MHHGKISLASTRVKKEVITMKLNKSKKENELYWYVNKKSEKLWMYRHKYYDALGKRKEKKKSGFKTEKAALKSLLEVKSTLLNDQVKLVEYDNITVAQWMDIWYNSNKDNWKITTQTNVEVQIRLHIKPLIGQYKLSKLDKSTYKIKFINVLIKKFRYKSVLTFHTTFKTAINDAVDNEILPRNRFNKLSIPNSDVVKENYLSPAELNKLLTISENQLKLNDYIIILTLAYTGFRKGELLGLQWKNINFDDNTMTVDCTRDNKGVRPPKTQNSYRTIDVDAVVFSKLKIYKSWCKQTLLKFGKHLKPDDYVFISKVGNPIDHSTPNYWLNTINQKYNLKEITPHGLRHTHATILLNEGIPVKVIADRLGNTPEMINNIYGHVLKKMKDKTVQVFGNSLIEAGAKSGAK
ncbi:tyrosine-type recombinase/integrase [Ornithinibacillus sp. 4-3]|uniref:Tyrosine-type recombinase/integrase n=1 Tax=Ornithinibacillus sp. 4-3 TaxID=3231488 RepID=A0AB39HJV8_9BACI